MQAKPQYTKRLLLAITKRPASKHLCIYDVRHHNLTSFLNIHPV